MPGRTSKRLVPLGNHRNPNFRYLNLRSSQSQGSQSTSWASCNKNITEVKFLKGKPPPGGKPGIYISGLEAGLAVTVFATFVFAPLTVPGLLLGYGGAGTGTAFAITTTGVAGNLGLFFTGLASSLGFASPYIQKPKMTNFNKPCSENVGVAY